MTKFTLQPGMHLHLLGIGGAGMSAIARVLLGRGFVVSGSDMKLNEVTAVLQTEGAIIDEGHQAEHITGADALVITSAAAPDNPEIVAAEIAGIPILKRADFLGQLMAGHIGIAIAGTHGKTTTTGMIAQILLEAELDPTVIVGGMLPAVGGNGRAGQGDYFVIEADEYDHMFLGLRPELIVITNIEHDHPDIFATARAYDDAYQQFAALLPDGGRLVACADDPGVARLLKKLNLPGVEVTTYGLGENSAPPDYQAVDLRPNQLGGMDFLVETEGQMVGLAWLRAPGKHNVLNALAAIIVGLDLGVDFNTIRTALAAFSGINRRFELIGEVGDVTGATTDVVTIIDDYAHHPTEIEATLQAARQRYPGRRLWAVWQPHTFSRTKLLQNRFAACFAAADRVVALDIYRSRETETLGMDTAVIVQAMNHPQAVHIPHRRDAADYILERVRPGDVILTLGAGDGNEVGKWILEGLEVQLPGRS
ncbi:MAG TPA: UDP-N-acetylmuramate--L-alanine ligase [Chloroflexota bacterium]|nr:UDP-N-acetylmuramate--L-alanine ligase [Chloroflexota bacterium]